MKARILYSITLLFICLISSAQDNSDVKNWFLKEEFVVNGYDNQLYFEVIGKYKYSVKKEKLKGAMFISDFVDGYPVNWMDEYVSTDISCHNNGKIRHAISANGTLSAEQKIILQSVDHGDDINITVKYKTNNAATNKVDDRMMNLTVTVVPEMEAEFIGGYQQLSGYLKKKAINTIYEAKPKRFQKGKVTFTIDEMGKPINVKITMSSGDSETDKLLFDTIERMPKWKPAENAEGVKVKQEFVFNIGNYGC